MFPGVLQLEALALAGALALLADDASDRGWRSIDGAPLELGTSPASVWTGEELVVFAAGGNVALDPVARSWRVLGKPTQLDRPTQAFWTGDQAIVDIPVDVPRSELNLSTFDFPEG
ncbi:hypothetical protein BH24ACT3_BH24ACT3_09490 [soil metagenome]